MRTESTRLHSPSFCSDVILFHLLRFFLVLSDRYVMVVRIFFASLELGSMRMWWSASSSLVKNFKLNFSDGRILWWSTEKFSDASLVEAFDLGLRTAVRISFSGTLFLTLSTILFDCSGAGGFCPGMRTKHRLQSKSLMT